VSAAGLSPDAIERGLIDMGVPKEKARQMAYSSPLPSVHYRATDAPDGIVTVLRAVVFPLCFTLPWSALVSDNRKYNAAYTRAKNPTLVLSHKYREAKKKAAGIAREAMGSAEPVAYPLALHARVWVPDNRPGHDVANFAKCCHDALEKVVYVTDEWLYRITWERAGVDVDRPRAEITISRALTTSEAAA
jgi:Holliday junction resolvase RusA-like endonuclease